METHHRSEWSPALGRSMEFITHGHAGLPAVVFPCMGGRPWDYADFGMIDVLRPWLDAGRLRLFCVDSIDNETFNSDGWDKRARAALQDRYHHYIADDLVPRIHDETGWGDRLLTTGNSLGGLHAAISLFRRPDLFGTMIALSGVYHRLQQLPRRLRRGHAGRPPLVGRLPLVPDHLGHRPGRLGRGTAAV